MNVTRNVISDLLPLYLANEASVDTRALVEAYLATDEAMAAEVREQAASLLTPSSPATIPTNLEVRALQRARTMLSWKKRLYALAIALTVLTLSLQISFKDGHLDSVGLFLGNYPIVFAAFLALTAGAWAAYFMLRRRTTMTGL